MQFCTQTYYFYAFRRKGVQSQYIHIICAINFFFSENKPIYKSVDFNYITRICGCAFGISIMYAQSMYLHHNLYDNKSRPSLKTSDF